MKRTFYARTYSTTLLLALSLFLFLSCFVTIAQAKTIYVDTNAPGANNGLSWTDAYNYLQDALVDADASPQPLEIHIAQGVYTPDRSSAVPVGSGDREAAFHLISGAGLKGGYAGVRAADPNVRDVRTYETILSGDLSGDDGPDFANNSENSYHVITASGTDRTAILDGVIITGGNAYAPGDGDRTRIRGGGMYNESGSPTVTNCVFRGNIAKYHGAAMANRPNSHPLVVNCSFTENSGYGAMYNYLSHPTLIECVFRANRRGTIHNVHSDPELYSCIFIGNSGGAAGAVYNLGYSYPSLYNCTIWGNTGTFAGAVLGSGGMPSITNCILWGNSAPQISRSASVEYSNIQGGWAGEGNIDADPLFLDPDGADDILGTEDDNLQLSPGSPCIDAGTNSLPEELGLFDLSGNPRIIDDPTVPNTGDGNSPVIDIGAYEFLPAGTPVVELSSSNFEFVAGLGQANPSPQFLEISNRGEGVLNWTIDCNCGWLQVNPVEGSSAGVANEVTLAVELAGLPSGEHDCTFSIYDPNMLSRPRLVTAHLDLIPPIIGIDPNRLGFLYGINGPDPEPQTLFVWNDNSSLLNWQISTDCNWLDVSPQAGQASGEPNEVVVTVDATGLELGQYNCELTISEPNAVNSPQYMTVDLTVRAPVIGAAPNVIDFVCPKGGPAPEPQVLSVWNSDAGALDWEIAEDCNWLIITPTAGTSTGEVNEVLISIDPSGLDGGMYNCSLTISGLNATNSPQYITVNLDVQTSVVGLAPEQLRFWYSDEDGESPTPQVLSIWNAGVQTLNWQLTTNCNWVEALPASGQSSGDVNSVTITVYPEELPMGSGTCLLTISDPNSLNKSRTVTVATRKLGTIWQVPLMFPTIQDAIDRAEEGDIILVEPGRYIGPGNRDIDFRGKRITVRSTYPDNFDVVAATVIDCNQQGRGFILESGEDANSLLTGFTIMNAYGEVIGSRRYGGGILCMNSTPVIANCILVNNTALKGGGIAAYNADPVIRDCIITKNRASRGGGVYGKPEGRVSVDKCVITDNIAEENGGGVYHSAESVGLMAINNCVISGNICGEFGGGFCNGGAAEIIACTINGNSAAVGGGGICTFKPGSSTISHTSNSVVSNSIIWGNMAHYVASEIAGFAEGHGKYTTMSISFCDVRGGQVTISLEGNSTLDWGNGNIDADPCFADPGYWQPRGSWVHGDYHLRSQAGRWDPNVLTWVSDSGTSLCIDAGDPMLPLGLEPFPNGGKTNIGAYGRTAEASKSYFGKPPCEIIVAGDINGDCMIDARDFMFLAGNWLVYSLQPPGRATNPNPQDTAVGININPVLAWEPGPHATSHNVYFGTTSPGTLQGNQKTATFDPGTLEYLTTYYWRIDEQNDAGKTKGAVWTVTTKTPPR